MADHKYYWNSTNTHKREVRHRRQPNKASQFVQKMQSLLELRLARYEVQILSVYKLSTHSHSPATAQLFRHKQARLLWPRSQMNKERFCDLVMPNFPIACSKGPAVRTALPLIFGDSSRSPAILSPRSKGVLEQHRRHS